MIIILIWLGILIIGGILISITDGIGVALQTTGLTLIVIIVASVIGLGIQSLVNKEDNEVNELQQQIQTQQEEINKLKDDTKYQQGLLQSYYVTGNCI